jgi:hypothetical protein
MLGFYVAPFVLLFLLWVFARRDADFDYKTAFFISIFLGFGNFLFLLFAVPKIGVWALAIAFFLSVWLLIRFCHIFFWQACLVMVAYTLVRMTLF